ncbi:unnamed protein product [Musa hybrid cultivar]
MLPPFLGSSQHYRAYEICVKKDLVREQVFLLGRMGDVKQALAVIISKSEDMGGARVMLLVFRSVLRSELFCRNASDSDDDSENDDTQSSRPRMHSVLCTMAGR